VVVGLGLEEKVALVNELLVLVLVSLVFAASVSVSRYLSKIGTASSSHSASGQNLLRWWMLAPVGAKSSSLPTQRLKPGMDERD
jgi:hypothetical protein